MWGNIFVCCRDQTSTLKPPGRADLETLYNSVLVASWSWSTNRWRIVYSGLLFGKLGSEPQTFVHRLTLSPGPSAVREKNCRKLSVTRGLPHSWGLLLDARWAFCKEKKRKGEVKRKGKKEGEREVERKGEGERKGKGKGKGKMERKGESEGEREGEREGEGKGKGKGKVERRKEKEEKRKRKGERTVFTFEALVML